MASPAPSPVRSRNRAEIGTAHKWNLDDIYPDWAAWDAARAELDAAIGEYAALKGTLAHGPDRLLAAFRLNDRLGQLAYKVYFYPSLQVRRGPARQRRQRPPAAGAGADGALAGGHVLVQPGAADASRSRPCAGWMDANADLARLPLRDRRGLPPAGARARRKGRAADVALVAAVGRAERGLPGALDRRREVSGSHAQHRRDGDDVVRPVPRGARDQPQPGRPARGVPRALRHVSRATSTPTRRSTTASASATGSTRASRGYETTLDAALHGNDIPRSVVDNLIAATRAGVEPLRRYHRLRRRALEARPLLPVRLLDSDRRVGPPLRLRRRARADRRRGRAARRRTIRRACGADSASAGSTSTKTTASAAARTPRPSTACTRTCS